MLSNENKKRDSEDKFTLVTRPVNGSVKASALFNLVEDLISEKNVLLNGYDVDYLEKKEDKEKNSTERFAYFIKFKEKPAELLFQERGYVFDNRHLTIDKFFSNSTVDKFGLRPHSTEEYVNKQTGSKIIVHVYFGSQGEIFSVQLKRKNGEIEEVLPVTDDLRKTIVNNAEDIRKLFNLLRVERANKYVASKNKANNFEENLDELYQLLSTVDGKDKFKKVAKNFIQAVELINRYQDDKFDTRGEKVSGLLKNLKAYNPKVKEVEEDFIEPQKNGEKNELRAEKSLETFTQQELEKRRKSELKKLEQEKRNQEKKYWLEQLQILEPELDRFAKGNKTAVDITNAHQAAEELKIILANLVLMDGFSNIEERGKVVKRIEQKISSLPNIPNLFEKYFSKGEVENFKELYQPLQDKFDGKLCIKFLENLVYKGSTENQIKICEFLFESSELYRAVVAIYSNSFGVSFKGVPIMANVLVKCCVEKNLELFKMLLRHGYDTSAPASYYLDKSYSLLKNLVMLTEDHCYVEEALRYGASLNQVGGFKDKTQKTYSLQTTLPKPSKNKQKSLQNTFNKNIIEKIEPVLDEVHKIKWDLVVACQNIDARYQFIPILAPLTDISGLAVAIATIMDLAKFSVRLIPRSKVTGSTFVPFTSLNTLTKNYEADPKESMILDHTEYVNPHYADMVFNVGQKAFASIALLTYSTDEKINTTQALTLTIASLFDKFNNEIVQATPDMIKHSMNELTELAESEKDSTLKKAYYRAMLNIMFEVGPLSCGAVEKAISYVYKIALNTCTENTDNRSRMIRFINFQHAFSLATETCYSEQLVKSSWFIDACKGMEQLYSQLFHTEYKKNCIDTIKKVRKYYTPKDEQKLLIFSNTPVVEKKDTQTVVLEEKSDEKNSEKKEDVSKEVKKKKKKK